MRLRALASPSAKPLARDLWAAFPYQERAAGTSFSTWRSATSKRASTSPRASLPARQDASDREIKASAWVRFFSGFRDRSRRASASSFAPRTRASSPGLPGRSSSTLKVHGPGRALGIAGDQFQAIQPFAVRDRGQKLGAENLPPLSCRSRLSRRVQKPRREIRAGKIQAAGIDRQEKKRPGRKPQVERLRFPAPQDDVPGQARAQGEGLGRRWGQ